ncbi:MAG: hypothetical protein AAGC68_03575, partial [Verrucomicrobiota bacterium]
GGTEAEVVSSTPLPLKPPASAGFTPWDVDGDGTRDFRLWNSVSQKASFDDSNGGRLVVPSASINDAIAKLPNGFVVGETLAAGYKFFDLAQSVVSITSTGGIGPDAVGGGWSLNDNDFFGFRFTSASGTHYGWGRLNITGNPIGQGFTIEEAYYETVPGVSIIVGDKVGDRAAPSVKVRGKKRIRTERGRVRIRGTATDDRGVTTVRYQVGKRIRTARGTSSWRFALRVKEGRTKVRILATDPAGNVSSPARVTVIRR